MLDVRRPLARLGANVINGIWRAGTMARFFALVLASSATSFGRFRLVMREVYFSGVLSLIIIIVSGLFIGMVLGLQGYQTLQR
ncbi:MAG TPA: ABC transporter permease, partial [Usitatibacter sp.]